MLTTKLAALTFKYLNLRVQDTALLIEINNPKSLNALSNEVIAELDTVFDELLQLGTVVDGVADWSVRGVILSGSGTKSFVAGADIAQMAEMSAKAAHAYAAKAQALTLKFAQVPVPVIAAVNGYALGGGCEIALACDYIYASENAIFAQPEVSLGLIPGFGGTVRLWRKAGVNLAAEMIYSGAKITAERAYQAGLVNQVFADPETLLNGCFEHVSALSANSPTAIWQAKKTFNQVLDMPVAPGLAAECDAFALGFETADMREGTSAFLAKTKPQFQGQ